MSVRRTKKKNGKDGPWIIDVDMELPSGKQVRVRKVSPIQTRRGAAEYERELREHLLAGDHRSLEDRPPTFEDFRERFMTDFVSPSNKASELTAKRSILRLHLGPAFDKLYLKDIDEAGVNRFIKHQLVKGLKPKTVNNHLILLRTILGCARDNEVIPKVPKIRKLRAVSERVDFLDDDEKKRLVTVAAHDSEWHAAILIALNCGLRLGEIIALKWEDVDLVSRNLWVRRSDWQGVVDIPKSGKARNVPLNSEVTVALKRIRNLKGEWIFARPDGSRRSKDEFASALERLRKRAGLRGFGWHMLRHTFASHLACKGIPLHVIKELLGHASLTMTMRYAHLGAEDSRRAVEALETFSAGQRQHSGSAF